jgi:light-regulated signal transduction histidine kinase (bacteriophytochrome)
MDHYGDSGLRRLLPLFGGLMVAVAWLGLWWDAGVVRDLLPSGRVVSLGLDISPSGAVTLFTVGIGGMVLTVLHLVRLQRKTAALLALREAELSESRGRLRRYVADLERVADVSAHDLQEPLRRMVAYSQLLEHHDRGGLDDEAKGYVSQVVDSARRMKALISGLRAYVSVDSLVAPSTRVSAVGAVGAARARLNETLIQADAALVVDPLPDVVADHASLVEVFVQLLDNAVRFRSDDRRPVIHVSAERNGAMVEFSVRDNGIGIEPNRVARMFEIFYRPHGADRAAGCGIGMGLAVVRRLVERLGGSIKVGSRVGEGSTFSFVLPSEPMPISSAETIRRQEAQAT